MLSPAAIILLIIQALACIIIGWSGVITFLGLIRRKPDPGPDAPNNRFAVIVCARNEEKVIRKLMESLKAQDYPPDCWHVYLLADHCTDGTALTARAFPFVTCYERFDGPENGKGAVLNWGMAKILREKRDTFDALLIFDADNVAAPDFMKCMNRHLNRGLDLVQGCRLAGEPFRTVITQWYACYWPLFTLLYSYPREKLGLSCFLTGTGFAVKKSLLEKVGWSTSTITEDVEFAFQQVLRGSRASLCIDAVCYDEQPSSFTIMVRQLTRWCTGNYQIFVRYFRRWCGSFSRRKESRLRLFDNLLLLFVGPCAILMLLLPLVTNLIVLRNADRITVTVFTAIQAAMFLLGYVFTVAGALIVTRWFRIPKKKLLPGLMTFPVFLWVYSLCSLYALVFPQKRWKPIAHEGLTNQDLH